MSRNRRHKARNNHRCGDGANGAQNAVSGYDQSSAEKEACERLKNKVRTQAGKSTNTLHGATLHPQRSISGNAKSENADDPRAGNVQICGNGLLRNKESHAQSKAGNPCFAEQVVYHSGFAGISLISGHELGADQVEMPD